VLLDRGVISTSAFSALTLMAVITTLLAMPLARLGLRWIMPEARASTADKRVAA
jgi:hypothetical protein